MGILTKLKSLFKGRPLPAVSDWFMVRWDENTVFLDVRPPSRKPWTAQFRWNDVERVCLKVEDLTCSDGIYVFTSLRPESWVIPTEAAGGLGFLDELIKRELFDAELAIKAAAATEGLFCWPPPEQDKEISNH